MDEQKQERQVKAIFGGVKPVAPSSFFSARVVARFQARKADRKEAGFWRWIAAGSLTAALALTLYVRFQPKNENHLVAFEPYVIHVNLDEIDTQIAASAEVELPEGVSFVSKNEEIKTLRSLRLPISGAKEGRSRLPFVVQSDRAGTLPLQVRIYDADDELIETKTMALEFVAKTPKKG